jgi:hypothetical protein
MSELIATLEFNSYPNPDEILDVDGDVDEAFEVTYGKKLSDFLNENTQLSNISYIGINTRYTERIMTYEKLDKLKAILINGSLMNKWYSVKAISNNPDATSELRKGRDFRGTVFFEETDPHAAFDYIDRLGVQNYCAFCEISCINEIKWYRSPDGKMIMVCEMDTESG